MAQKWLKQLQATNAQNALNAKSQYSEIDADGDGKLTAKELAQACDLTILEAEDFIEQYDANGDGTLDAQEFEQLKQQILQQQRALITNEINANTNYNDLDANNDGTLSAAELADACNITVQEATDIIMQYDANGDGMLDANEFEALKQQILAQQTANMTNNINANDTYKQFDANNDGRIDAKEFANACNISEQEAQNIIYQYDVNGDGTLDQDEFEDLKQQILEQQRQQMTENMSMNDEHNEFDANNDGRIDAKELANACNISVVEAQNIIAQYDQDGDGKLDENEFEELKKQILRTQQQTDDANPYVTASGTPINEDVAAYQSAVYDNNQPQMAINNSNDRNKANTGFVPYNEKDNAPVFSGNIDKVNQSEYNPNNSNAKAFGVDIFSNDTDQKQQYNESYETQNNNKYNANDSPFGKAPQNNSPFGKEANNNTNNSPFGKAVPPQNNSPFGQRSVGNSNKSPFGQPPVGYNNKSKAKPAMPFEAKPRYAHQWALGIKFDLQKQQIILNVSDDSTHKKWRKIVTKQEYHGDIKEEYRRIARIVTNGKAEYTYPPKGVGAVQVLLSKDSDVYNFYANPINN